MIALVVGGSRGIGLGLVRVYLQAGYTVYATCRKPAAELQNLGAVVIEGVDVATEDGVQRIQKAMEGKKIDVLVLNSGVLHVAAPGDATFAQEMKDSVAVNATAPAVILHTLLPNLQSGSKVLVMSTRAGSSAYAMGGMLPYRASKAALNSVMLNMASTLKPQGVALVMVCPGPVVTDMLQAAFGEGVKVGDATPVGPAQAVEDVAPQLKAVVDELTVETTGRFVGVPGEVEAVF